MSRFKKGDTVWMGRGENERKMVVAKVINNPMLPVYQYSFEPPHDGFACGEQSIRAEQWDEDLKISDCYKDEEDEISEDDEAATRINTSAMMTRTPIDLSIHGVSNSMPGGLFFKPNLIFTEWLAKYANGRVIVDVGAGQGHLVRMLKMSGARALGIEPLFNYNEYMKYHLVRGIVPDPNEMMPMTVKQAGGIISGMGNKAMLIFARPCHSDFVVEGLDLMSNGSEALYITVPENLQKYNDLGHYEDQAVLLEHEGISEDNEVIYSIKK